MKFLKLLQGLLIAILTVVLSVAAFLTASAFKWANELPELTALDSLDITAISQVYSSDGRQFGQILPVIGEGQETAYRIPVSLDEVSPAVLQAFVAYEDDQYFKHYGIDLPGIGRAVYEELFGDEGRGGSSITTQVIKNTVLRDIANERSLERKVKEWMLAIELERRLTKAEILQRYINVVFWGGQIYGIRAAADAYFSKSPIELNLAEGLYLARLIPAPNSRWEDDFSLTRASMRQVLDKMVAQNMVSQDVADRAWRENLQPNGWSINYDGEGNVVSADRTLDNPPVAQTSISSTLSDYVVIAVRNWLTNKFGEELVYRRGGLKVYTTIDYEAQLAANEASLRAEVPEGAQLAFVGLDPATGEILAMMGGRLVAGEKPGELNRALQSSRQPGSSFKPIAVAAAIETAGMSQATVLLDEPTIFKQAGQPDYEPANYDNKFIGAKTIRYHLDGSRNIPAIKALEAASALEVAERATELGYEDVLAVPSIALGTIETTPLQHAAAYGAFANGGVKMEPYFIDRVEDADGNILYQAEPRLTRVWSPQTAYIGLDLLYGNVNDASNGITGFSNRAKIPGRWVGGKTGTTNSERDIWFVGITPGMVSAVWIGFDDNSPIPQKIDPALTRAGDGTVGSSRQPVYIWKDFVENALRNRADLPTEFPVPEGIVMRSLNLATGQMGAGGVMAAFNENTIFRDQAVQDNLTIEIPIDTRTNTRATATTPRENIQYKKVKPDEIAQYLN